MASCVHLFGTLLLTILWSQATTAVTEGYCNKTVVEKFHTPCTSCMRNDRMNCPESSIKLTAGEGIRDCTYFLTMSDSQIISMKGCSHQCERLGNTFECCKGYWGRTCEECPGGHDNACYGHGDCMEGIEGLGTCTCYDGFTGSACEQCANGTMFGPNCTEVCQCVNGKCDSGITGNGTCDCYSGYTGIFCDEPISECENLTCSSFSRCLEIGGNATCVCDVGYEDDNGTCVPTNACLSMPCHEMAQCQVVGPAQYECSCLPGYKGDGVVCQAIDPCTIDYGGCVATSSVCVFLAANKSMCDCKAGYQDYQEGVGCSLIDMCTGSTCHPNASCSMVGPFRPFCDCKEGFVGDGQKECFGNIYERLKDLNENDGDLRNTLDLAIQMVERLYKTPLAEHGPFTVFIPNNQGFKNILRSTDFFQFLADTDRAQQVLRQHIVIGQFSLNDLFNVSMFYTLQGNSAELSFKMAKDLFRYRVHGSSTKAKIVKGDLLASNGVIHVTNSLLTLEPDVTGDPQKSLLELIQAEGRYNRFQTLISTMKLDPMFSANNITVFVPNNGAWDSMPVGSVDYLMSDEGKFKLEMILKHHVFNGTIPVSELINKRRIISKANTVVEITVTGIGQIQLDGQVNVSQVNLPCRNGLYYHVDSVLVPADMGDVLPRRCDEVVTRVVKGQCEPCHRELSCPNPDDVALPDVIEQCNYWVMDTKKGIYRGFPGCARQCNRTYTVKRCCAGFYGTNCDPCPGGFQNPCGSHGQCIDGYAGNGSCACDEGFTGAACDKCLLSGRYGPNCTDECQCLFGECDDGPEGTGRCKARSCRRGYIGENCDKKLVNCGGWTQICHAQVDVCYQDGDVFRCVCPRGYEGDGETCTEIDPCLQPDRGGCHKQAECSKWMPGMARCDCREGWVGDGFVCHPSFPCDDQSQCPPHATCQNVGFGMYHCVCKDGYLGNGSDCNPTDSCLTQNGGCHTQAICISTGPGTNNCTCKEGYGGDGRRCFGTIRQELVSYPALASLARLLEALPQTEDPLGELSANLTFLAPSDSALIPFLAQKNPEYWQDPVNVLAFIRFHTLDGRHDLQTMVNLQRVDSPLSNRLSTLYDGFSLHILTNNQTVVVFSSKTHSAQVTASDLPAVNGLIHVIDKVLEPFIPDADLPELDDFFTSQPEYAIFGNWLEKKGFLETLEDMNSYTLFAPTNQAMRNLNVTVTQQWLSYYVLPNMLLTPGILDGQTAVTSLGEKHLLVFKTDSDGQVTVNSVPVLYPDQLTAGGVVHGITGLLHPVLNRCDSHISNVTKGPCVACGHPPYPCPQGFNNYNPPVTVHGECTYALQNADGTRYDYVGCYNLCGWERTDLACCAGYFGPDCQECPGGPELPCSGRASCRDGIEGDGQCVCQDNFHGPACEECQSGMVGPFCNTSKYSCDYQNGNCSDLAVCSMEDNQVRCQCRAGYQGDGKVCLSPCQTDNGGCDANARCSFDEKSLATKCQCLPGYYGNGTSCWQVVDLCAKGYNGGCSPQAECRFHLPEHWEMTGGHVTCHCLPGYVGNGTSCTNHDLLAALSHSPKASIFTMMLTLQARTAAMRSLLQDDQASLTLFAPVDDNFSESDVLSLQDIESHLVNDTVLHLNSSMRSENPPLRTQAGGFVWISRRGDKFYVNGVDVVQTNVLALNGYLHLVARPLKFELEKPPVLSDSVETGSRVHIAVIVGPVLTLVLLLTVAILAVFAYRKRATGFLDIFRMFRKDSDSSMSFARLHSGQDDEEEAGEMKDPFTQSDNVNFKNPIYNTPDSDFDIDTRPRD